MTIQYPITPGEDSAAMALITAALQAAAQYVSVRHQIPINNVLAGMSVSANLLPPVNMALQAFHEKQLAAQVAAATPAPAPPPQPPSPPKQAPRPQPVVVPQQIVEPPPPNSPAYAIYAARALSQEPPAPIPSALTDLPKPEPVPVTEAPLKVLPEVPLEKKPRGRPKKVVE